MKAFEMVHDDYLLTEGKRIIWESINGAWYGAKIVRSVGGSILLLVIIMMIKDYVFTLTGSAC